MRIFANRNIDITGFTRKIMQTAWLIACFLLCFTVLQKTALAAPNNTYKINQVVPTTSNTTLYEKANGVYEIELEVSAPNGIPPIIGIDSITKGSGSVFNSLSYTIDPANPNSDKPAISPSGIITLIATIDPSLPAGSTHKVTLSVNEAGGDKVSVEFSIYKTSAPPTTTPDTTDTDTKPPATPNALLMLSPIDANNQVVPAPSGNYGDRITVRVPILNRGSANARASRIIVTPQISATLDNFPFVIEAVDYSRSVDDMSMGQIREVSYNLQLSKEVTAGIKEVKFNAVYYNSIKQEYETATFSVFVTVVKGKTPPVTGEEGEALVSTPKLIIESYSLIPDKSDDNGVLYAGEQFSLSMKIRNTADVTVKNIQMTLDNTDGTILPANNGSNTLYIDRIGVGEVVERTVLMQSAPETEPKSHMLSVKFGYESASTLKSYEATATVSLPIRQRIRMRIDDPVIMETTVSLGQSVYVYFNIINMGNSSVKNLMVNVEGNGLRMEEAYYGGNISSGMSTTADFAIIPDEAGEIKGKIIISYEDAMGEEIRVEKPFTLSVMGGGDMFSGEIDPTTGMPVDMGGIYDGEIMPVDGPGGVGGKRLPLWLTITLIVVGAGAAVTVAVVVYKKKRKKSLEDA